MDATPCTNASAAPQNGRDDNGFRPRLVSRFRTKLLLLVLLLTIPAFILVFLAGVHQRKIEKKRVRDSAVALSELAAAHQVQFIRNTRQLMATLSEIHFLVLATNAPFCDVHFSNLRKLSPDYVNFGLINLDGNVFSSTEPTKNGLYLGDRSYFQRVLATKRFSISDFQIGRLTGQPVLNFGYPIVDEKSELKRVLFASLKLSLLSESIAQVRMPADSSIIVIDRVGNVVARYPEPEKWVGRSFATNSLVQWILKNRHGVVVMRGIDGAPLLNAVTPITDGDTPSLFVSVGLPLKASFAHANALLAGNCVLVVLVGLTLLLLAWWYSQRLFLGPVNALVSATHRFRTGDLKARAEVPRSAGELTQLAQAFNAMAETLQTRQAELQQAAADIAAMNAGLEQRVRERTAELEAVNKELEAFSYSVSHDLRGPLRHIDGFIKLSRKHLSQNLDEKAVRFFNNIQESTSQMGKLIDGLLSFSRMGRSEMYRMKIDLGVLANEVVRDLATEVGDRMIQWKIGTLPEVQADPVLMRQVLANLFSNAVKYTRTREHAEIEFNWRRNGPHENIFFVRDNGVGFDMKYSEKLFGIFQRLHHSDEFEGTGIGLANVQRIITRHGGRVWAEAEPDRGATFYFSFPSNSDEQAETNRSG
jgi:signal transduction histidine kinase